MNSTTPKHRFRVALTADFHGPDGTPRFRELGLDVLRPHEHIEVVKFTEHRPEIGPDQVRDVNGVIVLTPAVTARSLSQGHDLLAVGRFGVGYDAVDVAACTAADVV